MNKKQKLSDMTGDMRGDSQNQGKIFLGKFFDRSWGKEEDLE